MALPKGRPTWLSYYHSITQEKGTRGEAFKTDFSSTNTACTAYTEDETKLANEILEMDKVSFIILPTDTPGKIKILHHCMIDETDESEKKTMGVHDTVRAHLHSLQKKKDSPPSPPGDESEPGSDEQSGSRDGGRERRGSRSRSRETDR
jgi:hypothetical protein